MITTSIPICVILLLLTFVAGELLGIFAVFHKLHRRFGVPWTETLWGRLTLKVEVPYRPYKLVVAGNYGQFRNWVQTHIIHAYAGQHLVGRPWPDIEIIKVGDWRASPVLKRLREYMSKEEWEQFLDDPVY